MGRDDPAGRSRRRAELRRRVRGLWRDAQWWLIAASAAAAFVLGFVGFRDYEAAIGASTGTLDVLYLDLQLFVLESGALREPAPVPATLQIARFLAPAVAGLALIRAFALVFRDELQLVRARLARDHVVVCGLGRKGAAVAHALHERGDRVVVIERDEANDLVVACRDAGIPVIAGDVTDVHTLRRAGATRSRFVVSLCGDSGVNAEVAVRVQALADRPRSRPLTCIVHVVDPQLCALLRARVATHTETGRFRLDYFNTFERGAQALLIRYPAFPDVDAPAAPTPPRMLVVGLGEFGASIVTQATLNWSAGRHTPGARLHITVIDINASSKTRSLLLRHPEIARVCDLDALELDARSPEFASGSFLFDDAHRCSVDRAYVCFDDDAFALATTLVLHSRLREHRVPIVMRVATESGLHSLLRGHAGSEAYDDIHAFALLERTCDPDVLLGDVHEIIARALHDTYLEHRAGVGQATGAALDDMRKADPSLAPWAALPASLRASNLDQAAHTDVKLRGLGCVLEEITECVVEPFTFTDAQVERLAELEHERFVAERLRNGWTLGPRDVARQQSPYLVPWDELSFDVQEYDRVFIRRLPTILAKLRLRIAPDASASPRPQATGSQAAAPHPEAR